MKPRENHVNHHFPHPPEGETHKKGNEKEIPRNQEDPVETRLFRLPRILQRKYLRNYTIFQIKFINFIQIYLKLIFYYFFFGLLWLWKECFDTDTAKTDSSSGFTTTPDNQTFAISSLLLSPKTTRLAGEFGLWGFAMELSKANSAWIHVPLGKEIGWT